MTRTIRSAVPAKTEVSLATHAVVADTQALLPDMPTAVELVGPIANVLEQVCALSRLGFTVNVNAMPSMFAATGTAIIVMMPGDPAETMVGAATQAKSEALLREQFVALDAEKLAAIVERERVEKAVRDAERLVIESQIAIQQESIRQLQASLDAA